MVSDTHTLCLCVFFIPFNMHNVQFEVKINFLPSGGHACVSRPSHCCITFNPTTESFLHALFFSVTTSICHTNPPSSSLFLTNFILPAICSMLQEQTAPIFKLATRSPASLDPRLGVPNVWAAGASLSEGSFKCVSHWYPELNCLSRCDGSSLLQWSWLMSFTSSEGFFYITVVPILSGSSWSSSSNCLFLWYELQEEGKSSGMLVRSSEKGSNR